MSGFYGRDGQVSMRIVLADGAQRILSMPTVGGRIPASGVLAIRLYEATAHAWIRDDEEYVRELQQIARQRLGGDQEVLARYTAALCALRRCGMLDQRRVPVDYADEEESEGERSAES